MVVGGGGGGGGGGRGVGSDQILSRYFYFRICAIVSFRFRVFVCASV